LNERDDDDEFVGDDSQNDEVRYIFFKSKISFTKSLLFYKTFLYKQGT
jgi:hypothetical protein